MVDDRCPECGRSYDQLITLAEAGEILGMSGTGVRYHVRVGRLKVVTKEGKKGLEFLSREAVERFKAEREKG